MSTAISIFLFLGCVFALCVVTYDVVDQWIEDIVEKRLNYYGDQVKYWKLSAIQYQERCARYEKLADRYKELWTNAVKENVALNDPE